MRYHRPPAKFIVGAPWRSPDGRGPGCGHPECYHCGKLLDGEHGPSQPNACQPCREKRSP